MTTEDETPSSDSVPEAPKRRRRAASRPAGPPAGAVEGAEQDAAGSGPASTGTTAATGTAAVTGTAAAVTQEASGTTAQEQAAPAARTARKRASRARSAASTTPAASTEAEVAPAEPAAQASAAQNPADGEPGDAGEPDAGLPAATRRRRARKAPTPARAAAEADAQEPATDVPAPARRGRGRGKATASPSTSGPSAAGPEAEEPQAAPALSAATGTVTGTEDEDEDDPDRRPVLAMPLFQAPDLSAPATRRTRRAASRPAGPPQPGEAAGDAAEPVSSGTGWPEQEGPVPAEQADEDVVDEVAAAGDEDDEEDEGGDLARRRRRRRGGRGRRGRSRGDGEPESGETEPVAEDGAEDGEESDEDGESEGGEAGTAGSRRRRRRRRRGGGSDAEPGPDDPPNTVVKVREARRGAGGGGSDDVTGVRGSTRLEAKKQRRREGREAGRRRPVITEAEFLARREAVDRMMVVREREGRTQIGVLEDGVLVEHYVARRTQTSTVGNVYLGKVQNVLPSMEAAFVDIGKGRNAVLYAGEVNWDAAGLEGQPKRIEHALKSGEAVLVQVTKDPIGHKGARLTSQVSLPGRYLVYVPDGSMTGISRKLPDTERTRLKKALRAIVPEDAGVIVRTAAEGASEEELERDVARLRAQWEDIARKATAVNAPALLYGEPDLAIRVVRDIFNEDFARLVVSGDEAWDTLQSYIGHVAPDLVPRLERWTGQDDIFAANRIDEQLAKALDRKVWLPSGGSLVIDRTEAMTVVDVNTGKFTGAGGNLEETVTKNNLEAAEEIVRQLRLRDIGGIIVVDFIDMVLESNRDLVLRRLLECLGRDRTKHQVAEVTSLGLVQMTRKRVGQGLLEVFSETCEHCGGRGIVVHDEPVEKRQQQQQQAPASQEGGGGRQSRSGRSRGGRGGKAADDAAASGTGSHDVTAPAGGADPAAVAG